MPSPNRMILAGFPGMTGAHLTSVTKGKRATSEIRPLLVFSHLRWNFVYQRPQHLLTRFQRVCDVHVWEEPLYEARQEPGLRVSAAEGGVRVVTPLLPEGTAGDAAVSMQRVLLDNYVASQGWSKVMAFYYTPMALQFSAHLSPAVTVYDCMDELSAFQGASPKLISLERELFARADVVFCGGASLYAAKRNQHGNVHLFPSSIEREHFAPARTGQPDPGDQAEIPHPRVGFYGVLDERLDRDLLRDVAALRPDLHFVLLGPVAKIRESDLPVAPNLHYLGQKTYDELPRYLANWDVAMLPFARNASTEFISPTKTPEYLAGGRPVVSTPIRDVVTPYGDLGLVKIAATAEEFSAAVDACMAGADEEWLRRVDAVLGSMSWDKTCDEMWEQIEECAVPATANAVGPITAAEAREHGGCLTI